LYVNSWKNRRPKAEFPTVDNKITIRDAVKSDVPKLVDLGQQLGYKNDTAQITRRLCELSVNQDAFLLVAANEKNELMAFLHARVTR
jgi:hypothetical protein